MLTMFISFAIASVLFFAAAWLFEESFCFLLGFIFFMIALGIAISATDPSVDFKNQCISEGGVISEHKNLCIKNNEPIKINGEY